MVPGPGMGSSWLGFVLSPTFSPGASLPVNHGWELTSVAGFCLLIGVLGDVQIVGGAVTTVGSEDRDEGKLGGQGGMKSRYSFSLVLPEDRVPGRILRYGGACDAGETRMGA